VTYALGIPVAVAYVTALRSPVQRDATGKLACTCCARRDQGEYAGTSLRAQFAFLFNGYSTDRSAIVVAWEALVMLRKLAVSLAGSMLRDPYLQILVALLILVVSALATAYMQPYETWWLNLLDTLGLFSLIVTQILSIVYFYAANAAQPFMPRVTLEILVTALLIFLNGVAVLTIAIVFACELLNVRFKFAERTHSVLKLAEPAATRAALRAHASDDDVPADPAHFWCHPSGVATSSAPKIDDLGVWVYRDAAVGVAASENEPQLLILLGKTETLAPNDKFRRMEKTTRVLSAEETQLNNDVGGCGSTNDHDEEPRVADLEFLTNPGLVLEMAARERRASAIEAAGAAVGFVADIVVADESVVFVEGAAAAGEALSTSESDEWFWDDYEHPGEVCGPCSTPQLQGWVEAGHFSGSNLVRKGREGAPVAVSDALGHVDVAEWFYDDDTNPDGMHGPFTRAKLRGWVEAGHFRGSDLVRKGREGAPVALEDAIDRPSVQAVVCGSMSSSSDSEGEHQPRSGADAYGSTSSSSESEGEHQPRSGGITFHDGV
jgi:hypothetical protein